jgi:hypothetical protein
VRNPLLFREGERV